ncbi:MAG TPA: DUF6691 family protein [Candidatus Nanoarchaeia archaeon]|nr:DUF6691 family protein [Candidatus Nanoarchaeia archaeon]
MRQGVSILLGGVIFGFGLALSGMTKPELVLSFLQLRDLGLLFVMGGAVVVAMIAFQLGPRLMKKPLFANQFGQNKKVLDKNTIIGAAIFGLGWGISGLCPGSAIASLGTGNFPVLIGVVAMFLGAYLQGILADK